MLPWPTPPGQLAGQLRSSWWAARHLPRLGHLAAWRWAARPACLCTSHGWLAGAAGLRAPRTCASRALASACRPPPPAVLRACWPPPPAVQRAAASHAAHAHHARSSAPSQRLPAQEQRKTEGKRKEQNQNFEPKLLFQTLNQSK